MPLPGPLESACAAHELSAEVAAEMPGLYRYAISLVGNRSDAEEAVGDAAARAFEHRDQCRGDASIRTWLHRILNHIVVDRERRTASSGVPPACSDARRQVSDYLDGDRRRLLEEHLARHATCPPLFTALVGARDSLGTLHDPDTVVVPEVARRTGWLLDSASGWQGRGDRLASCA